MLSSMIWMWFDMLQMLELIDLMEIVKAMQEDKEEEKNIIEGVVDDEEYDLDVV